MFRRIRAYLPYVLVLGFALWCAWSVRGDLAQISPAVLAGSWDLVLLASLLSLLNYVVRIVRWRTYLAQLVSMRSGLPQDEAFQRVTMVENDAREAIKSAADKAATAGAFFSFWTFMALLFGGAAATLAGILGGQIRDEEITEANQSLAGS